MVLPEASGASPLPESAERQPNPCASPQEVAGGDPGAEILPVELLAALPEDAHEGHEAYRKVKFAGGDTKLGGGRCTFIVGSRAHGGWQFQTTLQACNSRLACERIARACYVKSAGGATKQEVTEFRDACYKRFLEASHQQATT